MAMYYLFWNKGKVVFYYQIFVHFSQLRLIVIMQFPYSHINLTFYDSKDLILVRLGYLWSIKCVNF